MSRIGFGFGDGWMGLVCIGLGFGSIGAGVGVGVGFGVAVGFISIFRLDFRFWGKRLPQHYTHICCIRLWRRSVCRVLTSSKGFDKSHHSEDSIFLLLKPCVSQRLGSRVLRSNPSFGVLKFIRSISGSIGI